MNQTVPRRRFALPPWYPAEHVVVRAELRHWRKQKFERFYEICIGGMGLLVLLASVGSAVWLLPNLKAWGELWAGLWLLSTSLAWLLEVLMGLMAGVLAAFAIAREREAQTWVFLQVSTLLPVEIVGGKWAALFYFLRRPLTLALLLRIPIVAFSGLSLIGSITYPTPGIFSRSETTTAWGIAFIGAVFGSLLPFWAVAYHGAIGLAASTLARARNAALITLFAIHFGIGVGYGLLVLVLFSGMSCLGFIGLCIAQWLTFVAFFNFAVRRVQTLTD